MSGTGRLRWADVAKGACIVLVVLWHVTKKDYLELPWSLPVPVTGVWGTFSQALLPVRMPLFFAISGLFAARQLALPWRTVLRGRVATLLWVFVLWTLVQTVVLRLVPGFDTEVARSPLGLLRGLTVTPGNLWYLLALAAYVVVARLLRSVPDLALAAALLLSAVAAAGWVPTPENRYGLLTNLVWFLLGTRLAGRVLPHVSLAWVPVFAVACALWLALGADAWFGVRPALGLLGILAGASVAGSLASVPRLGDPLAALGRRTLPVYVLHLPLVALAHLAAPHWVPTGSLVVAAAYPALVTALVVAACLLLHVGLERVGARWLFSAPGARRARSAPGCSPAPRPARCSSSAPAPRRAAGG